TRYRRLVRAQSAHRADAESVAGAAAAPHHDARRWRLSRIGTGGPDRAALAGSSAVKVVVFGPEKRVGIQRGEQIIDLSLAYAKYLKERRNERHPTGLAAAMAPSDLAQFIDGGARALECAATAIDHLFGDVHDQLGVNGEMLLHKVAETRLHAPLPNGA